MSGLFGGGSSSSNAVPVQRKAPGATTADPGYQSRAKDAAAMDSAAKPPSDDPLATAPAASAPRAATSLISG